MIQVKVFDEQHEDDLTDSLNEFLAELDEKDVLSVQLTTSHFSVIPEQLYSFSGMIVYRIKSAEMGNLNAGGDDDE
ncbi:sporulation protein Cse60 [Holdemania filiformis]|uniref:sporulation protein Cse60 n=1 Tax=Holdemania filiformis TaxID=61171 RepID=UPI002674F0BC|nr:sporulation protein Cse60 [Holdemania filiformis]